MMVLDSMLEKLLPLGLYDLDEGSNVFAELSAYAEALQRHKDNTNEVLRECFISSSESFGLDDRESLIGFTSGSDFDTADRREMLILRKSINENDFTVSGFTKMLRSFGVASYQLTEHPSQYSINVAINGIITNDKKAWIESQIMKIIPVNMTAVVEFDS